ncbi:MAG: hypothetical protein WDZ48_11255 [Pirellulales bacterium]
MNGTAIRDVVAATLLFSVILQIAPVVGWAAPITVPSDLNVGDKYRLAFVTSATRDATSPLIADYNDFVTAVANGVPELAALGTTWSAVASTPGVDAFDNTDTDPFADSGVPIYRLDDIRIANDNSDLWDGSILAPLSKPEVGQLLENMIVWTGTSTAGTGLFALSDVTPLVGDSSSTSATWINEAASGSNTDVHHLYGISGELTVVPEPITIWLACIGILALAGWRVALGGVLMRSPNDPTSASCK